MFTGIIAEVGAVTACTPDRGGLKLRIDAPGSAKGLPIGGSVAVDGVCLTAVAVDRKGFTVQVVPETVARTTLRPGRFAGPARRVNLERPLVASSELGGHFVQGHVDARARVISLRKGFQGVALTVELPANLASLVVEKGSIAVNGVSLTVASVGRARGRFRFSVALIPHTLERTNLGDLKTGDWVNVETDILGKHVQRLLGRRR